MAFGGFGATPASSSFGSFGSSTTFGSTPAFGAPATTSAFGAPVTSSVFGAAAPSTGFGTQSSSAFGTPSTSSAFGGSSLFGGGSSFGITTQQPSSFGGSSAFGGGLTSSAPGAFGGFGATQQQFGTQQQQQQQQQQLQQQPQLQTGQSSDLINLFNAVTACSVFADDRDALLARWNLIQACWGVGKAVYSSNAPPVTLTPDNQLCRFKAVGYSALPKVDKESECQLTCMARKKPSEFEKLKPQLIADLSASLGNRPNVVVNINGINGYDSADLCEVIISVSKFTNGSTIRKVMAAEVMPTFSQAAVTQGLQQKYSVEGLGPRCAYTEEQLRDYLENPPMGIDPRLWRQAQLDNPDPKKLIPVPMIGFKALQTRLKCQELQAKNQQSLLDSIATDISKLQKNQQETSAKLLDAKRKQIELGHRLLKIIIGQEVTRKRGYTIQHEEETLRIQLEALQSELSAPTQFKGRLNELLSQVRLASQASALSGGSSCEKYNIDPFIINDIKSLLKQQQEGLQALVTSIKQDMTDLNLIVEHSKVV